MASGDITHVKVLWRLPLSGGRTKTGVGANDKVLVCGEISCSWADTGIEVVNHGGDSCFGVSTLDFLRLQVLTANALYPDAQKMPIAAYDVTNRLIFVVPDEGQATPANLTEGQIIVMRFIALGDDADAPVLT